MNAALGEDRRGDLFAFPTLFVGGILLTFGCCLLVYERSENF
jgi:hypothetical protein